MPGRSVSLLICDDHKILTDALAMVVGQDGALRQISPPVHGSLTVRKSAVAGRSVPTKPGTGSKGTPRDAARSPVITPTQENSRTRTSPASTARR